MREPASEGTRSRNSCEMRRKSHSSQSEVTGDSEALLRKLTRDEQELPRRRECTRVDSIFSILWPPLSVVFTLKDSRFATVHIGDNVDAVLAIAASTIGTRRITFRLGTLVRPPELLGSVRSPE